MLGALASGDNAHQRFPGRRGLPGDARARCAPWACASSDRGGHRRASCTAPARRGCRHAAAALDMGNAGTAMRLMMGLLAPQPFDSTLIGDASLMRRPMERVAVPLRHDGRAHHDPRGPAAGGDRSGAPRAARHRLHAAGGQRAGEVRDPARGAARRRAHARHRAGADARSHRAHARRLRRRSCCTRARPSRSRAGSRCAAPPSQCRAISPRRRFSWSPACSRPHAAAAAAQRRREPDAHRAAGPAAAHGRRHPRAAACARPPASSRSPTSRYAGSALRGIEVPEALVPLAIDELPVFFIAAACAEGETVVRGAHELRVKESDRLAAMAQGLERLGVEHELLPDGTVDPRRGTASAAARVDSRGDHRIAMAFAMASAARAGADRDPRRGQRRHLLPGLRGDGARGGLGHRRPVTTLPMSARPTCPVVTIDGPSGSGKGTISRAVARHAGLAPAGQRRAVSPGGPGRACTPGSSRTISPGMPRWRQAWRSAFGARGGRGERVRLGGAGRDGGRSARRRPGRAPRGWPPGRRCAPPSWSASAAFARPPGLVADGRDMGTVVFPQADLEDLPHGNPGRAGPAAP